MILSLHLPRDKKIICLESVHYTPLTSPISKISDNLDGGCRSRLMTSDGQSMSSGDCSSSVPSKSSPSGCSSSDVSSGSLGSNGCAGSSGGQQPQPPQATVASAASVLHRPQGSSKRSSRDERTVLGKSTDLFKKKMYDSMYI